MITYDVDIGYGTGWIAIVPAGVSMYVHNTSNTALYYKFGIANTSIGLILESGDYLKVSETIYIKDNSHYKTRITIVGE